MALIALGSLSPLLHESLFMHPVTPLSCIPVEGDEVLSKEVNALVPLGEETTGFGSSRRHLTSLQYWK